MKKKIHLEGLDEEWENRIKKQMRSQIAAHSDGVDLSVLYRVCEVKSKQKKNIILFKVSHTRVSLMRQG